MELLNAKEKGNKKNYSYGSGGQKGWVYSIDGIMGTLPASQYKDPPKILILHKSENKK